MVVWIFISFFWNLLCKPACVCGWLPDVALMLLYIISFATCTDFPVPLKGTSKKGYRLSTRKETKERVKGKM